MLKGLLVELYQYVCDFGSYSGLALDCTGANVWRADDLVETLEATQAGPVWMMGHSMGAAISTIAAARRPQLFHGLILIDPILPRYFPDI